MKTELLIATIGLGSIIFGCVSFQNNEAPHRIVANVSAGGTRFTNDPDEMIPYAVDAMLQNDGDGSVWVNCPPDYQLCCRFEFRTQIGKPWTEAQMPDFEALRLVEIPPRSNLVCHVHFEVPLLKDYHRLYIPVWTNPIVSPSFELLVYPDEPEKTGIIPFLP